MLNFWRNINKKSKLKANPPINCDVSNLVSYIDTPLSTELKYNDPLLCISIGSTCNGFAYEVNFKNEFNEYVGYLIAHVYNGTIEDFSIVAYTDFDYANISNIPITDSIKFGDHKHKLVQKIGIPDEDTSEGVFNDLYSLVYIRTINNKKYYFEFELFKDIICAMHVGLSN